MQLGCVDVAKVVEELEEQAVVGQDVGQEVGQEVREAVGQQVVEQEEVVIEAIYII